VTLLVAPLAALAACGSRNIDGAYGIGGGGPFGVDSSANGRGGAAGSIGTTPVVDRDGGVCFAIPYAAETTPVDLFFMVDKSQSMGCPIGAAGMTCTTAPNPPPAVNRWTSMREALATFAMSPASAGLGMGMAFFPIMNGNLVECGAFAYAAPVVPIATLPGAASALAAAINAEQPIGNTPTVPALNGAFDYARSYMSSHPGRRVSVVFATDGQPTECVQQDNSISGAMRAAAAAAAGPLSMKTFVLGVGPNLTSLNMIAEAGGTVHAHLVESGGSRELLDALGTIRSTAISCDYTPPATASSPDTVNVKTRVGPSASEIIVPRVEGRSSCSTSGGWYYDDNTAPTRLALCPATCDPLATTAGSAVTLLVGCASVGRLPP
jgi:hypothetical protein